MPRTRTIERLHVALKYRRRRGRLALIPPDQPYAVVLAAGLGTRMKSRRPKVLHALCGRAMLDYALDVARQVSEHPPVVVYSPSTSAVAAAVGDTARTALQAEPLGTADAVRAALGALPERAPELVVLSGDTPLLEARTVRALLELRRAEGAVMALATIVPDDPAGYGRVVRDAGGHVSRIVEEKDASAAERAIAEVNGGLYAFDGAWLRARLPEVTPSVATDELYLTELVALARRDAATVVAHPVADARELAGVNDRLQLSAIEAELRRRLLERHMRAGVTMEDPGSVYLDATVELAPDVVLEPGVYLRGATRVGSGTVVGSGSQLLDTVVGERCTIRASVLESSVVEDDVRIGPFAHLRPGSSIGRGGHIGNYAEVKNSRLEPGVQQHHVSYLGDAHVGERTNIGAGTITANFDGRRKLPTTIGSGAFIGVDTMLVAPVEVGPGAKTGAGAVVTRNVPAGKLAVGVPARIREPRVQPGDSSGTHAREAAGARVAPAGDVAAAAAGPRSGAAGPEERERGAEEPPPHPSAERADLARGAGPDAGRDAGDPHAAGEAAREHG